MVNKPVEVIAEDKNYIFKLLPMFENITVAKFTNISAKFSNRLNEILHPGKFGILLFIVGYVLKIMIMQLQTQPNGQKLLPSPLSRLCPDVFYLICRSKSGYSALILRKFGKQKI
jgi:hypothetical protein